MSIITPTITTDSQDEYRSQLKLIASYSEGVHLDFADGDFAPTKLLPLSEAVRVDGLITHAHIMYKHPLSVLDDIYKLGADLVILHAESEDIGAALEALQENGTRTGIALLPQTSAEDLQSLGVDGLFDHILVFGGHLGYQGGEADLSQLDKAVKLKSLYPDIEIAWDGGVNEANAVQIASAGVDILNVGGTLKNAEKPEKTYKKLSSLIQSY